MATTWTTYLNAPRITQGQGDKETDITTTFDVFDATLAGKLTKSVAGNVNVTLTDTEGRNSVMEFTGALTGSISVLLRVPAGTPAGYSSRLIVVHNNTTGAFTLTVKTTAAGSTGIVVGQGKRRVLYHNGTHVYDAASESGLTAVAARVFHSAAQSIPNITHTALAFNSERYDPSGMHDNATANSRLTCVRAGVHHISGSLEYAANATGFRQCAFRVNGVDFIYAANPAATPGGHTTQLGGATMYYLAVGDYVELMAHQDSGAALNVNASGKFSPEFAMAWIGE